MNNGRNDWLYKWMNKWMIDWINEWTNEWMNGWMDGWMKPKWKEKGSPRFESSVLRSYEQNWEMSRRDWLDFCSMGPVQILFFFFLLKGHQNGIARTNLKAEVQQTSNIKVMHLSADWTAIYKWIAFQLLSWVKPMLILVRSLPWCELFVVVQEPYCQGF